MSTSPGQNLRGRAWPIKGKRHEFSQRFIDKAKQAKDRGFNIYALIFKFYKLSALREPLPDDLIENVLDDYLARVGAVRDPWPYFLRVLKRKSGEYFAGKAQESTSEKVNTDLLAKLGLLNGKDPAP